MPNPLDELRAIKAREKRREMMQQPEFMLSLYLSDPTEFVEKLFNLKTGSCPYYRYFPDDDISNCSLSSFYSNTPNRHCGKYWLTYEDIISGVLTICASPPSRVAEDSAEQVFQAMWTDGYLVEKSCKRRSKGGPLAWVLENTVQIQNWFFNIELIGNS